MALPTKGTTQWLTSSLAIVGTLNSNGITRFTASLNAAAVSLTLPAPYVLNYTSKMFDYENCGLPSHFLAGVRAIATSSVRMTKNKPYLVMDWTIRTTNSPGVIDNIIYSFRNSLELEIANIEFNYATTDVSSSRYGLFINAASGSPHLSMYPQPDVFFETPPRGEMWMSTSGSLRFVEQRNDGTNAMYVARPIIARIDDSTSSLATRFATTDRPLNTHVGLRGLIVDKWLITANSPNFSGSGLLNLTTGTGLWMPNSGTVAVYGPNVTFVVPSGSLTVRNSFNYSGNLTIRNDVNVNVSSSTRLPGLTIPSGALSIFGTLFGLGRDFRVDMGGSGSLLMLNGAQGAVNTLFSTGTHDFNAVAFNGEWYLYSGSGLSGSNLAYVRANGQWIAILSSSGFYPLLNGGFF